MLRGTVHYSMNWKEAQVYKTKAVDTPPYTSSPERHVQAPFSGRCRRLRSSRGSHPTSADGTGRSIQEARPLDQRKIAVALKHGTLDGEEILMAGTTLTALRQHISC